MRHPTKRRSRLVPFVPAALLGLALVPGCGDRPDVTEPAGTPPPLQKPANKPPDHHATVLKEVIAEAIGVVDLERGLTAVFGARTLEQVAAICADPTFATDLLRAHIVLGPDRVEPGDGFVHGWIKGKDVGAIVWAGLPEDRISCTFQDVAPLAVGTVQRHFRIHEPSAAGSGVAFVAERVTGTLTNPATGQRYRLRAGSLVFVQPNGDLKVDEEFITLTPVGGGS